MLNMGMSEILIFAIIALIVLGPEKLPVALKAVARWYVRIKRFISSIQHDIEKELKISELRDQLNKEMQHIKQLEQQMQEKFASLERQQQQFFQTHPAPAAVTVTYHYLPQLPRLCRVPFQHHRLYPVAYFADNIADLKLAV